MSFNIEYEMNLNAMGSGGSKKGSFTVSQPVAPPPRPAPEKAPRKPSVEEEPKPVVVVQQQQQQQQQQPQKQPEVKPAPVVVPPEPVKQEEPVEEVLPPFEDVCSFNELKNGEMREMAIGTAKVLLVRDGDDVSALGPKCPHYGAPLVQGHYSNGRIRCPWHGACFNASTGDIEDFPGLDSLSTFEVKKQNGRVLVRVDKTRETAFRRTATMFRRRLDCGETVLIVGGGAAAISCSETLRQNGFPGRIVIVSKETYAPIDRPKLSKAMSSRPEEIALRKEDFFRNHDIELMLGEEVTRISVEAKVASLASGKTVEFDKLLLATGSRPRHVNVSGSQLRNVFTLRQVGDANAIYEAAKGKAVLIVGSSFIGMEVASCLSSVASSLTVVGLDEVPLRRVLGAEIGTALSKLHMEKGVQFVGGATVQEFYGDGGVLKGVVLTNGSRHEADVCVVGIGAAPCTEFLAGSQLRLTQSGFVIVDKCMRTNVEGVWAAGDIVHFPLDLFDVQVNIGHWQMALKQGREAAKSMLDISTGLVSVPFFWTVHHGKSLRYAGHANEYDEITIKGSVAGLRFAAIYLNKGAVRAVATMNADPIAARAAEMFTAKKTLTLDDLGWIDAAFQQ